jgi:threonyl-tRNA synthetase
VVGSAEVEAGTLKLEMRKGGLLGDLPIDEAVAMLAAAASKAVEPIDVQAL